MTDDDTLPLTEDAIREYLAAEIQHYQDSDYDHAAGAVHAYQNVHVSLFGELYPCGVCGETEPHGHEVDE